jgi:hypothetical protein
LEEGEGGEAAEVAAPPGEPPGYSRSKKRTLEELFKPPLDIMHKVCGQSYLKRYCPTKMDRLKMDPHRKIALHSNGPFKVKLQRNVEKKLFSLLPVP